MASPNISFDTIPSSIRKPGAYAEFNTRLAVRTLPSNKQRLMIIGQRLAAGTVAAGVPTKVFSDAAAATYFGAGSAIHGMIKAAITANPYVEITAVAVDDAAGATASTGSIGITGGNAQGGSLIIGVAGRYAEVPLTTEAPVQLVILLANAINARPDWPVVATYSASTLTITAKSKGSVGSDYAIEMVSKSAGFAFAINPMGGGSGEPDIAGLLPSLVSASDEIMVCQLSIASVSQGYVKPYLDARSNSIEQRSCVAVYGSRASLSTATSLGLTLNHGRSTLAALPGSATPGYEIAAAYASVIAFEEDPARPLNTLVLNGVTPPNLASRLSRTEQEACLANGVTPLIVGPGDTVQIVRAVTTYTTNPAGAADISLLDLTTIRTLDFCRKAWRDRIVLRFPREKKTAEVKRQVRSELLDVAYKLEELGIIENVDANKAGFIVEDDSQDPNRLNVRLPTDVVNGLHVFAARIDLLL
jgi:phage tail sheath gpL-like